MWRALVVIGCVGWACTSKPAAPKPSALTLGPSARPFRLVLPEATDGRPLPLLVLLHGYGASSAVLDAYWGASAVARAKGIALALPEGTVDSRGKRFWNATPACCDFDGKGPDDVAALAEVIEAAAAATPIDRRRVYVAGHSNGSFMALRLACARADLVTAIAGLAGADFASAETCVPSRPVSVLHLHGTRDDTIRFDGTPDYPSARETALRWAGRNGCDVSHPTPLGPMDLDLSVAGDETTRERWSTSCTAGTDVELWTLAQSGHGPLPAPTFMSRIADWLLRHRR